MDNISIRLTDCVKAYYCRANGLFCCSWLPSLGEEESRKRQEKALQLLKDGILTPLSGGHVLPFPA